MWPVALLLVRPQQSLYECGLVRSGGFSLFGVAIDVVDLVATEGIGDAQRDGVAVDVVAGVDAVIAVIPL